MLIVQLRRLARVCARALHPVTLEMAFVAVLVSPHGAHKVKHLLSRWHAQVSCLAGTPMAETVLAHARQNCHVYRPHGLKTSSAMECARAMMQQTKTGMLVAMSVAMAVVMVAGTLALMVVDPCRKMGIAK